MSEFQPLPRSLDPLLEESLPGYLLRLAHRLDLSPARVAQVTGLLDSPRAIPTSRMFALAPDRAEAFARATRLSAAEVTALTLVSLAARYPPLDPGFSGRQRHTHGIFVKETGCSPAKAGIARNASPETAASSSNATAAPGACSGDYRSSSPAPFTTDCSSTPAPPATSPPIITRPELPTCCH